MKRKSVAAAGRKDRVGGEGEEESIVVTRRAPRQIKRTGTNTAAPRKGKAVLQMPASVRTFSEAVGVPAAKVLGKLLQLGMGGGVNITTLVEQETADLLAVELGVELEIKRETDIEETLQAIDMQPGPRGTLGAAATCDHLPGAR